MRQFRCVPELSMSENTKLAPPTPEQVAAVKEQGRYLVTITMEDGKQIQVVLEGGAAPVTSANYINLVEAGFYNGLTFHRVVPDFVIQGGDPRGDGTGNPGYAIKLEIAPGMRHKKGAISMARSQHPDSAGSQFFLTLADTPHLDNGYAVFGWVKSGQDVVDAVKVGDTMKTVTVEPYNGTEPNPLTA
ncbi:MAG: peptidylprolyl isomerase [Armatimonadota bacterium]